MGTEAIQSQGFQSFECLQHCARQHPEYSEALSNIQDQIQQAYNIYLQRASNQLDQATSIQLVERFKQTAEAYPRERASAEHVLIWASYIAAAESSLPEHRRFFMERMKKFHEKNGFGNILKALKVLELIWKNGSTTKWTSVIPQKQIFVM